jgi:hypothetical protein
LSSDTGQDVSVLEKSENVRAVKLLLLLLLLSTQGKKETKKMALSINMMSMVNGV